MTTTHHLTTTDRYGEGSIKATDIRYAGRRFGVGAIPAGREGRQVQYGPMVPGPWAYAFATATVIAAHHIPEDPAVTVEAGDLLVIDGATYVVRDQRPTNRMCNDDWVALDLATHAATV